MFSTADSIRLLRAANPGKRVTEDKVRHVLRRGCGPTPKSFSGRLVWSREDVGTLALALGLLAPALESILGGETEEVSCG